MQLCSMPPCNLHDRTDLVSQVLDQSTVPTGRKSTGLTEQTQLLQRMEGADWCWRQRGARRKVPQGQQGVSGRPLLPFSLSLSLTAAAPSFPFRLFGLRLPFRPELVYTMRLLEAAVLLFLRDFSWCRGEETITRLSGSNVTFKADVTARPSEMSWYQGTSKIVELEEGKDPYFYRLKDRAIASQAAGTLLLMNVTPADNGPYNAELLIGGSFSFKHFKLQVFDHVCQVVIRNSTVENNVTLRCMCSTTSAVRPTRYQWYNQNSGLVSDLQNFTVYKQDTEQLLRCKASNEVSSTDANATVPREDTKKRSHIAAIPSGALGVLSITFILLCRKRKGSLTPSYISFKKANKVLMEFILQSVLLRLERLSVQREMLGITDVKKEDYATYRAEASLPTGETVTRTFICKSAQNGTIEQDDTEAELVYPVRGALCMEIPNAENAERIVWSKDGVEILTVICSPDPPLEKLALYKGALRTAPKSEDDRKWCYDAGGADGISVHYAFRLNDDALKFGYITFYPAIVEKEQRITWKKGEKILATREPGKQPQCLKDVTLEPESGNLTLHSLQESSSGQYSMEAEGPQTSLQEFTLTILREEAS